MSPNAKDLGHPHWYVNMRSETYSVRLNCGVAMSSVVMPNVVGKRRSGQMAIQPPSCVPLESFGRFQFSGGF